MEKYENNKLIYFSYKLFKQFTHTSNIISSRIGGVSVDPYHSLNIGLHVGDDHMAVVKNRALLCETIGVELSSLTAGEQVHETNIAIVTSSYKGRGATTWSDSIPRTDGLITNVPDLPLFMIVADCAVLSFFDPKRKIVALAHGGWRGIVGGIAQKIITQMSETFDSSPTDICVGIGPSIGPCCYEVRQDVVDMFHETFPTHANEFFIQQSNDSIHLDLWSAIKWQLLDKGIQDEHIEFSNMCSACRTDLFYSHRAENGKTGRFGGLISLRS